MAVPLFVSRRRLIGRKSLPRAICDWALDSGGFTELERGGWGIGPADYVREVRRYRDEIGRLQWAPVQDWMCEPWMVASTGLTVEEHQRRTVISYLELMGLAPEVPWVPVLQGWEADDYLRCAEMYAAAGVDLERLAVVGLGSVCRRQHMREAERIVRRLAPLRLHGFGVKTTGLARFADALVSSDSLAWSAGARRQPPLPGCPHRNCANCPRWALAWRQRIIDLLEGDQPARQLVMAI
jgi:hypothetical protein